MQLGVGMEPTFRFEHMICICKEMGIVKLEIFSAKFRIANCNTLQDMNYYLV